jgi:4-amino-4-deoxy-L-arabinose transferase-like glycosyltransferase
MLGNGFSAETIPPFTPYSYGVPGYPYFLFFLVWLTGSYLAVSMIQLLLGAVIPLLGMYLARSIMPQEPKLKSVPIAVGVLLAITPYQILFSFIFFTETVFTLLFGTFLILFFQFLKNQKTSLIVLSGLFLGLATLTKPTVQYVPILVIIFALWQFRNGSFKKLFAQSGYFLLIFIVVISPWLYRNYRTFGVVNLSAQISTNLYGTLLPSILAIEHHTTYVAEQAKLPRTSVDTEGSLFRENDTALKQILSHPVSLVKLSLLSAFTFFTHDGMVTFMQNAGIVINSRLEKPALLLFFNSPSQFLEIVWGYRYSNLMIVFFARLFWFFVVGCFALGLYELLRRRLFHAQSRVEGSSQLFFAVILVFYFMLTTMINGLTVNARFRMPVEPIIFTVACIGFYSYISVKKESYEQS